MPEKQFNVHFQNKPSAQNICSGVHEKRKKKTPGVGFASIIHQSSFIFLPKVVPAASTG